MKLMRLFVGAAVFLMVGILSGMPLEIGVAKISAAQSGPMLKLLKPAKLHVGPSGPSEVLEIVWRGSSCIWLDKQSVWVQVKMIEDGQIGWIHESYLTSATTSSSVSVEDTIAPVQLNAQSDTAQANYEGIEVAIDQAGSTSVSGPKLKLLKHAKLHIAASGPSEVREIVRKNSTGVWLDKESVWVQIRMDKNGHVGWIHHSYLAPAKINASVPVERAIKSVMTSAQAGYADAATSAASGPRLKLLKPAKLHVAASGPSAVREIVRRGATGVWLDKQSVWVQLRMDRDGHVGWIHQSYLAPVVTVSSAPVVSAISAPVATTPPESEVTTPSAAVESVTKVVTQELQTEPVNIPVAVSAAPVATPSDDTAISSAIAIEPSTDTLEPASAGLDVASESVVEKDQVESVEEAVDVGEESGSDHHGPVLSHANVDVTDQAQIRRGLTVFTDICMGCHSAKYLTWRGLIEYKEIGLSREEVDELRGDQALMGGLISDLTSKDAEETYGKAAPDLSLVVLGRRGGTDYIYSLLTGYAHDPAKRVPDPNYNPIYPGNYIAMPDPLSWLDHDSADEAELRQQAEDVATFLAFISDPHQNERRALGSWVVGFLVILTLVLWLLKREVWKGVKKAPSRPGLIARLFKRKAHDYE